MGKYPDRLHVPCVQAAPPDPKPGFCPDCDRPMAEDWENGPDQEWIALGKCYKHLSGPDFAERAAENDCLRNEVNWRERCKRAVGRAGCGPPQERGVRLPVRGQGHPARGEMTRNPYPETLADIGTTPEEALKTLAAFEEAADWTAAGGHPVWAVLFMERWRSVTGMTPDVDLMIKQVYRMAARELAAREETRAQRAAEAGERRLTEKALAEARKAIGPNTHVGKTATTTTIEIGPVTLDRAVARILLDAYEREEAHYGRS
jgi:hypothetical protein